jgi:hypothetical protein
VLLPPLPSRSPWPLRVVALNSLLYDNMNLFIKGPLSGPDPGGQMAWLARTLAAADQAGEKVQGSVQSTVKSSQLPVCLFHTFLFRVPLGVAMLFRSG